MPAEHVTTEEVQRLETEVATLRQALEDIASAGRELLSRLPLSKQVPGALAHGPLLTMVGLAEAGLAQR